MIDTAVLIDVLEDDPAFGAASALALDARAEDGLTICPVTYVELAPAFEGQRALQEEFLAGVGIRFTENWTSEDTLAAFDAWNAHVRRRRRGEGSRRPIADLLIGAFSLRFQGLVTRNPADFRTAFPGLTLHDPSTSPPA